MGLPNIKFNIATNGLERLDAEVQKTPALVITGASVTDNIQLGESHQIFSLQGAIDLGIEATGDNAFAYKHLLDFYSQADSGTPVWIMLVSDATSMEAMLDKNQDYAKKLVSDAKGEVRFVAVIRKTDGTETITDGLDADSHAAVIKGQELAEYFEGLFMPIRVLVSGNAFSGTVADLRDYTESKYNKVLMLIVNTDGAKEASIGLAMGRLAAIPSQRNLARVKDGAVHDGEAYFTDGNSIQDYLDALDTIHDKGYTFFRNFVGRAGYYFSDDRTLTAISDDYSSLARGFVMDEGLIYTYDTLVEELNDEVEMTAEGEIHPAIIKHYQSAVLTQLEGNMVAEGKLSNADVFIDPAQNVLATDKIEVSVFLQPVGYAKTIEVNIGFTTTIS